MSKKTVATRLAKTIAALTAVVAAAKGVSAYRTRKALTR